MSNPDPSPSLHPANFTSITDAPEEWAAEAIPALSSVISGFEIVAAAREDIMADETKTEAARLIALNDLYQQRLAAKVQDATKALEKMDELPTAIYSEIQAVLAPSQQPHDIVVASEVRQALARLSRGERHKAIEAAVQRGDRTTLSAVVNAPAYLTGVPEDALTGYRDAYIAKHRPEISVRKEALRLMLARAKNTKAALANLRSNLFSPADEAAITKAIAGSLRAGAHL